MGDARRTRCASAAGAGASARTPRRPPSPARRGPGHGAAPRAAGWRSTARPCVGDAVRFRAGWRPRRRGRPRRRARSRAGGMRGPRRRGGARCTRAASSSSTSSRSRTTSRRCSAARCPCPSRWRRSRPRRWPRAPTRCRRSSRPTAAPSTWAAACSTRCTAASTARTPRTRAAVEATRGEVLTYELAPIEAYFHASCGGHTESGLDALRRDLPYLQPVDCPCGKLPASRWTAHAVRARSCETALRPPPTGCASPAARATGRVTPRDARAAARAWTRCSFRAAAGLHAAQEPGLRGGAHGASGYRFSGRGYGHGAGLCQWGAKVLADEGWDYRRDPRALLPGHRAAAALLSERPAVPRAARRLRTSRSAVSSLPLRLRLRAARGADRPGARCAARDASRLLVVEPRHRRLDAPPLRRAARRCCARATCSSSTTRASSPRGCWARRRAPAAGWSCSSSGPRRRTLDLRRRSAGAPRRWSGSAWARHKGLKPARASRFDGGPRGRGPRGARGRASTGCASTRRRAPRSPRLLERGRAAAAAAVHHPRARRRGRRALPDGLRARARARWRRPPPGCTSRRRCFATLEARGVAARDGDAGRGAGHLPPGARGGRSTSTRCTRSASASRRRPRAAVNARAGRGAPGGGGGDHRGAHAGGRHGRRRRAGCARAGRDGALHPPGLRLPAGRRAAHQLPPAALHAADAGERVRWAASARSAAYREAVARATGSSRYGDAMLMTE